MATDSPQLLKCVMKSNIV